MAKSDPTIPTSLQPKPEDYGFDLESALRSVVGLRAHVPDDAFTATTLGTERAGSAVHFRPGLFLTIGYLITEAETIWLTVDKGGAVPAHVVAYDQESGFGLVQALGAVTIPTLDIGDSSKARPGDAVVFAASGGRKNAVAAKIAGRQEFAGYWEYVLDDAIFTAPAHPFWGGSALLDAAGKLVGIGSLVLQQGAEGARKQDMNMVVPTELLPPILDDLLKFGRVNRPPRPWLGLYAMEDDEALVVGGLADNGPADKAGLRTGDRILAVNGAEVPDLAGLWRAVWASGPAGSPVQVSLGRGNRNTSVIIPSTDRATILKIAAPALNAAAPPARRGWRQWLLRVLGGVAVVVAGLAASIAGLIWWTLPPRDMQAAIPGLSAPVSVALDPDGIPWIKAASETDAAAALGFLHARDRMFEMELMRRAASGRLSEIAGPPTLPTDRALRTLGLRRRAEAELPTIEPATRAMLDAYARGVNAWIARRGRFAAPEFLLLGAPEPWTPVDSLLWGKTMALYLAGSWRADVDRAELARTLPTDVRRALWPDWSAIPRPDASLAPASGFARAIPAFPAPFTLPDEASNEWAVDGAHSATGAPLLAGDPHLGFSFPSIWYLARIETPGGVLAGATAPGVPFLILGHNGSIAWTFTTAGADTQDVFVETVLPDGRYATEDGPRAFRTIEERIHVRDAPDDVITVRETRHGPVLSDLDPDHGSDVLAVAMAALQAPDTAPAGILALNRAQDLAAARAASASITAPVQNLLVADRERIGMFTTGRIPMRKAGDGATPQPGADGRHDWVGFAGGDALPHIVAPASGHLLNANEPVVGRDFPVFMGVDGFGDWRARRIRALLETQPKHTPAEFAAMQVDVASVFARQVLPALLAARPDDTAGQRALDRLRAWDGTMRRDRPEPLLFNVWIRRFVSDMLAARGIERTLVGPTIDLAGQALGPGGAALCGGDCQALLAQSLAETMKGLGPGWETARWGDSHRAVFAHPILGRLPLIGAAFTWSIAQPGDDSTLFRGGMRGSSFESVHGSSFRGVYDLADLGASLFALAPGQSGHPFSANAASLLERWRESDMVVLGPKPRNVSATITLSPGGDEIGR